MITTAGLPIGVWAFTWAVTAMPGVRWGRQATWSSGGTRRKSPLVGETTTIRISAASKRSPDYHIHASDGEIGHVEDFLVEDTDWSIHFLVVDTKNWWPGKKVLISPRSAQSINWGDRLVNLNVDRQWVKNSPTYDASTTIDGAYEKRLHDHYGDIRATGQP